ncbi:MAG: fasciclin domain-containing protein [Flavobacteriaceae bacterium]
MKTPFAFLLLFFIVLLGCKNNQQAEETTPSNTTLTETSSSNKGQAFIEQEEGSTPNALQLALGSKDHTTLVAAVQAAGVENALVNVGPLTVFAPTNAAFDKLPKETLEDLLKPENKDKLAMILKHHVAPSNYPLETLEKNVEKNRDLYMASGQYLPVTKDGSVIKVNGIKVGEPIKVSNGWVYVIDEVILPN